VTAWYRLMPGAEIDDVWRAQRDAIDMPEAPVTVLITDGVGRLGRTLGPILPRRAAVSRSCAGAPLHASRVSGMLRPFAAADTALSGDPIVHVVVVNRITLTVPVEEVLADIERVMPSIFASLEGFVGQTLVKTGPQELVVIGRWASPEAAANGAAVIGPGAFNTWVAPRASGQDRVVGEVVSDIGWGS